MAQLFADGIAVVFVARAIVAFTDTKFGKYQKYNEEILTGILSHILPD